MERICKSVSVGEALRQKLNLTRAAETSGSRYEQDLVHTAQQSDIIDVNCLEKYFFPKLLDHRVTHFSPNDRTVCLDDDVVFAAIFDNGFLLAEGMKLKKGFK